MYDKLLIPGTQSVPSRLLESLNLDESALVPYSPDLLAKWPAEIYSVSMADAAVLAHEQAHARTRGEPLASMAGMGDIASDFRIEETEIAITTFKLVLIAVWLTEYSYQGQQFLAIINGNSGEVYGDVPRKGIQKILGGIFGEQ
jgi:hypothetical protein